MRKNIFIVSMPRSGSSLLAQLAYSAGYALKIFEDSVLLGASELNPYGYYEEIGFICLNDQLIRIVYGAQGSFLYFPSPDKASRKTQATLSQSLLPDSQFEYDLDEHSVFMPDDFKENVGKYTGNSWDNWGLTRMKRGEKWYRCYERYRCRTARQIRDRVQQYRLVFKEERNLVVKDPRLGLVLGCYELTRPRIIHVTRDKKSVLSSMRKHYGQNLFTPKTFPGTSIVSNYFNHKIPYQAYDEYYQEYLNALRAAEKTSDWLELRFEDLIETRSRTIAELEDFLGSRVDVSLIDKTIAQN